MLEDRPNSAAYTAGPALYGGQTQKYICVKVFLITPPPFLLVFNVVFFSILKNEKQKL